MKSLKLPAACRKETGKGYFQCTKGEKARYIMESIFLVLAAAFFFYRDIRLLPLLSPLGFCYYGKRKKKRQAALKRMLIMQFKECLLSVSAGLKAGYSVENAFRESKADMRMLYGEESMILKELLRMEQALTNNVSLEILLHDFGGRSGCRDVEEFAEIFQIAKRSGGNLTEIIRAAVVIIGERFDAEQEITVLISGKRLEQKIMSVLPFGIVIYVELGNPGYFAGMYHNAAGAAIMTVCLSMYIGAIELAERILGKYGE